MISNLQRLKKVWGHHWNSLKECLVTALQLIGHKATIRQTTDTVVKTLSRQ
jgi:hypothetical protein